MIMLTLTELAEAYTAEDSQLLLSESRPYLLLAPGRPRIEQIAANGETACGNYGITFLFTFEPGRAIFSFMESYELIRSRRRTLALEITKDCRVLVRAPMRLSKARIDAFVTQHEAWIICHLERQRQRAASAPPSPTQAEIQALKEQAWAILPEKVAYWSEKMGLVPTGLKITAARKRYGSCNGKNSLCFSCFLMNCPEEAVDLVVVHELCHIQEKNHGPRFYALLEQYLPDYRERKKLLR